MTEERRSCLTCGKEFAVARKSGRQQTRCSKACRRKAANDNYADKRRPDRPTVCAECGGPISHNLDVGRPRRFCSEKCKMKAGNTRHRRALPPLRDQNPDPRACIRCGESFIPKRRDRVYCYGWCAQYAYAERRKSGATARVVERLVTCDGCGASFTSLRPEARWCSQTCANRHWGNVRARQRGVLSTAKYTDREIFERDGWICQICHAPVDRDVSRLHDDGATIDHVAPISRGGTDEPDNVVTAHWRCNRDKGARAAKVS